MPVGIICSHFVPFGREFPLDLIFQPLLKIRGDGFFSVTASWLKLSGPRRAGMLDLGRAPIRGIWLIDPPEETEQPCLRDWFKVAFSKSRALGFYRTPCVWHDTVHL